MAGLHVLILWLVSVGMDARGGGGGGGLNGQGV